MAEIIRPAFGNKGSEFTEVLPVPTRPKAVEDSGVALAETLQDDLSYVLYKENVERICQAIEAGERITEYIFSMAGFVKKNVSVDLRRRALERNSLEVLCGFLLDSGEHQWNTQPHYFGAIILEMNQRLQVIKSLCPDKDVPQFKD